MEDGDNSKDVYINVTLTCAGSGKKIKCRALLDTGNTVNARSVITRQLHNRIQAGFTEIGGKQINTAKNGSGLKKIGRSKEITMTIDGFASKRKFKIEPTVVEDLSDDLNLGNGFLAGTGDCDILYRGSATKLRIGTDKVELVRTLEQTEKDTGCTSDQGSTDNCTETGSRVLTGKTVDALSQGTASGAESSSSKDNKCNAKQPSHVARKQVGKSRRKREPGPERVKHVYCTQDVKVKKNTMTFIPAGLSCPWDMKKEILVEPFVNGNYETVAAVYQLREGSPKIAVLNCTNDVLTIPRGTKLGQYAEIEPIKFKPSDERIRELKEGSPKIADIIKKLKMS